MPTRSIPQFGPACEFVRRLMAEAPDSDLFIMVKSALDEQYKSRRVVAGNARAMVGGFFSRADMAVAELSRIRPDPLMIYVVPNPVWRADRGPLKNHLGRLEQGTGVSKEDIEMI
jgi:hypothetical protein